MYYKGIFNHFVFTADSSNLEIKFTDPAKYFAILWHGIDPKQELKIIVDSTNRSFKMPHDLDSVNTSMDVKYIFGVSDRERAESWLNVIEPDLQGRYGIIYNSDVYLCYSDSVSYIYNNNKQTLKINKKYSVGSGQRVRVESSVRELNIYDPSDTRKFPYDVRYTTHIPVTKTGNVITHAKSTTKYYWKPIKDIKPFTSELSFRIQNQTSVMCISSDNKHMFTIRPRFFFDVYLPYLINGRIKGTFTYRGITEGHNYQWIPVIVDTYGDGGTFQICSDSEPESD